MRRRGESGPASRRSESPRRWTRMFAGKRSEIHPSADAERARLIRQIADARASAALLIECQECALVREVVAEDRDVPLPTQHADTRIDDVISRQFGIECECVLRIGTADVVRRERQEIHSAESDRLI